MGKSPMPWFAMLPFGTLLVMMNASPRVIDGPTFVGAVIVAASAIFATWGIVTLLHNYIADPLDSEKGE